MTSKLLEYKSISLLTKKEEENDNYEEEFKEDLIKKLVDYNKYKEITKTFKELELKRSYVYTKTPSKIEEYNINNFKNDQNINDLINAFNNFVSRIEKEKPLVTKITSKELSVSEVIIKIKNLLKNKSNLRFDELFDLYNKEYIVVTFLAILEMVKKDEIIIEQKNNFDEIIIKGCV